MLGTWFFSKLRSAERALAQGRLDDAFRLIAEGQLRGDKRADGLCARVGRGLLARARVRAQEARHRDALDDLERVRQLGQLDPDGEALRARVLDDVRDQHLHQQHQLDAVRQAHDHVQAGHLDTGRAFVDQIEDRRQREQLREQLDVRADRARAIHAQADAALRGGDVLPAVRLWNEALARHGREHSAHELALRLAAALRTLALEQLRAGRLDRFCAAIDEADGLRSADPALEECFQIAANLRLASAALGAREFVRLREALLRLTAIGGTDEWLREALATASQLCTAHDRLLASPFAIVPPKSAVNDATARAPNLYAAGPNVSEGREVVVPVAARNAFQPNAASGAAGKEAAPVGAGNLLVLVDAAGSFLLAPGATLRIGRAGGSARVDVPLPADIASHHADIIRNGEDYFLVAHGTTTVNRRPVTRALLRDGDRVVLGTQGRFTFQKPSSKSASAVLRLADRCRLAQDVSRIVLFADTCLVGPQPSCHVQTRDNQTRLVLFERGGRLHARRVGPDGRHLDTAEPVALGRAEHLGDQRLTVTPYA